MYPEGSVEKSTLVFLRCNCFESRNVIGNGHGKARALLTRKLRCVRRKEQLLSIQAYQLGVTFGKFFAPEVSECRVLGFDGVWNLRKLQMGQREKRRSFGLCKNGNFYVFHIFRSYKVLHFKSNTNSKLGKSNDSQNVHRKHVITLHAFGLLCKCRLNCM